MVNLIILSVMFLSLLSGAQTCVAPVVILATDKPVYAPSESVAVAFEVTNTSAISADWLWFYVDDPTGRNVFNTNWPIGNTTDFHAADQYVGTWQCGRLPDDAVNGTYLVSVMWSHEVAYATFDVISDHYAPIPDIPPAFVPLALLCALAASVWLLRKKTVNIPALVG